MFGLLVFYGLISSKGRCAPIKHTNSGVSLCPRLLPQIAMVSPGMTSCEYTMNTLRYADRYKFR